MRVVRMKFRPGEVANFRALFSSRKATIAAFDGCLHLELWQDAGDENIFCTYSRWESEAHLNRYRFSPFFKETWGRTRALFAEKAEAWSVRRVE